MDRQCSQFINLCIKDIFKRSAECENVYNVYRTFLEFGAEIYKWVFRSSSRGDQGLQLYILFPALGHVMRIRDYYIGWTDSFPVNSVSKVQQVLQQADRSW